MFPGNSKILVVDDMLTMRMMIKRNLDALQYINVKDANDGVTAWKLLEEAFDAGQPYQLVLSDWNMPNMSGLEFLIKVRGDDRFKSLPFVMITAEGEKSQVMEAIEKGVTYYIVKPFSPAILKDKLEIAYKAAQSKVA